MNDLKTICHLDGRNFSKVQALREYFSEYAIIKYRLLVEIKYLQALAKQLKSKENYKDLDELIINFNSKEAQKVRDIEKKVNHDIKAVEYYLKDKTKTELVHFAVAAEDINNLAFGLLTTEALQKEYLPLLNRLINEISSSANKYRNVTMLARTHGQPAPPTALGKEFAVFANRLQTEFKLLKKLKLSGKLSGSTGNYNSFVLVKPKINWQEFSKNFVYSLGVDWSNTTTQIIHYECYIRIFDSIRRINNILLDFVINIWYYISLNYFRQKRIKEEVGSSSMPHKINPITFEAAEGNLGFANSMFEYFARKLPLNRMQRDLSDSTIRRNFGLAFAYSYFAYKSVLDGLSRITPNREVLNIDLNSHYEVLMEGVANYLRLKGYNRPYEKLKKLARGKIINKQEYKILIRKLRLNQKDEVRLLKLRPSKYLGYATTFDW